MPGSLIEIKIQSLGPALGARVTGIDVTRAITDGAFELLRRAFDEHSVLVLPTQPLDDEAQMVISERFGPVEQAVKANLTGGTPFARQSNIDPERGELISLDDRRMLHQKQNFIWHLDSSYRLIPSLCSLLSAREVPPVGGDTEFASTRAAFESLSDVRKNELRGLFVIHDIVARRRTMGFEFTAEHAREMPPVRHPLVQMNAATGRESLLIGAHADRIDGWPEDESRVLLDELLATAAREENVYRHEWADHDLVIWDNRSALHRATHYDATRYRRLMQRTTVQNVKAAGTLA
jgi:alpha-ketoglutarate-dependent 2,4-dichlorophenoxyacetate dioxygenase